MEEKKGETPKTQEKKGSAGLSRYTRYFCSIGVFQSLLCSPFSQLTYESLIWTVAKLLVTYPISLLHNRIQFIKTIGLFLRLLALLQALHLDRTVSMRPLIVVPPVSAIRLRLLLLRLWWCLVVVIVTICMLRWRWVICWRALMLGGHSQVLHFVAKRLTLLLVLDQAHTCVFVHACFLGNDIFLCVDIFNGCRD